MERILVYAAYPLWRKNSLVGFARAKELQDEGHDVTVGYCAAKAGACICNQAGNPIVCGLCRTTTRLTAKRMGLKAIPLGAASSAAEEPANITLFERKELVDGVLSGLISVFRLLPADVKKRRLLRFLKRRTYATALRLLKDLKRVMSQQRPDRFEVFNGRHACSKSGLIAAKSLDIPFNTLEVTASRRPIIHHGHTAHDRSGIQARIKRMPIDMELAGRFYASRRRPRGNKFAKHHSHRFQVPSAEGFQRLVSIFLSSQDEFASLGKTWKSSFAKDHVVIERICRQFPETLFCIRFHPNQGGIKSDITSEFRKLEHLHNARIYYPAEPANTYHLVDASACVVVFNSTVAAEACWAGKPVIMIGPSFYDQLDIGYAPADERELSSLLARTDLAAKSRDNAARLAHYFLKEGDEMKYVHVENGHMTGLGVSRSLPILSIAARSCNTLSSEAIKPFV